MKLISDLHIHSHYSLATSKQLTPEYLDLWGRMKGIQIIATGDFTHPGWTKELQEKLEPAEPGLFKLKKAYKLKAPIHRFDAEAHFVRFILSAEISSIYKKTGKVRKIHNVLLASDFQAVEKMQQKLINIGGNITSDGRPILGLDAKDLLEMSLSVSEDNFFIPAHIWTPWFSALGAKSGFDSLNECFEELTPHIYAVETGLSTNAPMNWMCRFLDDYTLISNSDAHSPEKLGRNANIMDCDLSYDGIIKTMKNDKSNQFLGTIDMYPQGGKYHYDGHRKCGVVYDPVETLQHHQLCEKCGRKITVGVMNRIVQLSDRENLKDRPNRKPFHSIIPLKELLSEITGVGPKTKTVAKKYNQILSNSGSELDILLNIPIEDIQNLNGPVLAQAIERMRKNEVIIQEGFDGQYGVIKVFKENELKANRNEPQLFPEKVSENPIQYKSKNLLNFSLEKFHELFDQEVKEPVIKKSVPKSDLNDKQLAAVKTDKQSCLVLAGPGTGKTKTLVSRLEFLINQKKAKPKQLLAITFTNKAADEIKERIEKDIDQKVPNIFTFHKLGLKIIRENIDRLPIDKDFTIIDDTEQRYILKNNLELNKQAIKGLCQQISHHKQKETPLSEKDNSRFIAYEKYKNDHNIIDLDDLVYLAMNLLKKYPNIQKSYQKTFKYIHIDEFQDINQSQFNLIKLLTAGDNLFAIGDVNQAIYGFRGSEISFIKNFTTYFDTAKTINFTQSYRCTDKILHASNNVIQSKYALNGVKKGVRLSIHQANTEQSEAEYIARKIEMITGGMRFFSIDSNVTTGYDNENNAALDEIVVLCRSRVIIPAIEKAFMDHAIPYEVVNNRPFYREKPVKSIINYFKIFINPQFSILHPTLSVDNSISLENKTTEEIIQTIITQHFTSEQKKSPQKIQRLLDFAKLYKNPNDFLERLTLEINEDFYQHDVSNVKIMTLHAAKGLEFEHVFIAGCEDKLLPYSLFKSLKTDYNEEKRLFYVGMTRSKKYLYLSHTKKRKAHGMKFLMRPSPFLVKIEKKLLKKEKNHYTPKSQSDRQMKLF